MKTKFILTGILLLLPGIFLFGQEKEQDKKMKFIYLESGIDFISCEQPSKEFIRADIEPYYDHLSTSRIRALMHNEHFGVKFEYRFAKNLLGISSGLHYTRMFASIGKPSYWSGSPEFFYVNYRTEGITTEYAKVLELNQRSDYAGIPVELRIFPYKERMFNVYYKAGASFNLNVGSKTDVVFHDVSMDPYRKDVAAVVEPPFSYYGSLYLGAGIKIGRLPKPGFVVEATFPAGMLIPGKPGLVKPQTGGGIQVMFRVPLNKNTEK